MGSLSLPERSKAESSPEPAETSSAPAGTSSAPAGAAASRPARWWSDRAHLAASLLIVAGLGYRAYLVARQAPLTNSDEATMGLAALHIMQGRDYPIFFYGQSHMGTVEAYLAAPLMWLIEPSTTALRLPLLGMYAAFAVGMYVFTRMLFTPGLALFTTAFVALGSDRIIKNQLIAGGGYPEISPAAVWLLVLSLALATGRIRVRPLALAGWGLIVGFLLWDDWLILPYVAAAAVLLATRWPAIRRHPRRSALAAAGAAGLCVGAAPLIVHHLIRPLSENSINVFLSLSGAPSAATVGERLYGGVVFGIPMGMGMCSPSRCAAWQTWWAGAYLVLLVVATALAVRELRRAGAARRDGRSGAAGPDRLDGAAGPDGLDAAARQRVAAMAWLAVLAAGAVSLLTYARSGAAGDTPIESARYLSATLISLPAIVWPLWRAATARSGRARPPADGAPAPRGHALLVALATAVLAALLATAATATVAMLAAVPDYRAQATQHRALVNALLRDDVRHVYSDYWTCNLVAFATRERVVCAVLADDLRPGLDRYRPYRSAVGASDNPAFVTPERHPLRDRVRDWLDGAGTPYRVVETPGYRIWRPSTGVHPPR